MNLSEVQYHKNRSINTTIRTQECVTPDDMKSHMTKKGGKSSWVHWINTSIMHKDHVNKTYYNKSYNTTGGVGNTNDFEGGFSMRKTWKNRVWENMSTWTN